MVSLFHPIHVKKTNGVTNGVNSHGPRKVEAGKNKKMTSK